VSGRGWTKGGSRPIADCRIFQVRADTFRSARTGVDHEFFIIDSPDWVNVLPFTDSGEILLVRQHRFGTDAPSLEVPGGMVDPGEDPLAAGRRELLEETGYAPKTIELLGTIRPNPAIHPNTTHSYLALGCEKVAEPHFDSTEDCELVKVPITQIDDLLRSNAIDHSLVAVAFLHWKLRGSRSR